MSVKVNQLSVCDLALEGWGAGVLFSKLYDRDADEVEFQIDGDDCFYILSGLSNGSKKLRVRGYLTRPHIPTWVTSLKLRTFSSPHLPDWIGHLTGLIELDLGTCTGMVDLGPIIGLINLVRVRVRLGPGVDIGPIGTLTGLQQLELPGLNPIIGVKQLGGLKNLTHLDLSGWDVVDLSPLNGMQGLKVLELTHADKWDTSPLDHLPDLVPPDMPDLVPLDSYSCFEEYAALLPLNSIEPLRKLKNLAPLGLSWRGHVYT
jgi:Leucine-rich repeat (LRR) protein